jgi:hypothetical protein
MPQPPQKTLNGPKKIYLTIFAIALLVTVGLIFGKGVDFGQFLHALTGSLTDASRYNLPANPASRTATVVDSGLLKVKVEPDSGQYQIKDSSLGSVAVGWRTGAGAFPLPVDDYSIEFKDVLGYDKPIPISVDLGKNKTVAVTGKYVPWPACTFSDWKCDSWTACDKGVDYRRRACAQVNPHCSNADKSQPLLYDDCKVCKKEKRC